MRYTLITSILCFGIVHSSQVFASSECKWKTWPQLLNRALEVSPEFTPLKKRQELGLRRIETASVGPAANASAQYLSGTNAKSGEGELAYAWTIESSEKTAARVKAAQSELGLTSTEVAERQAAMILDVALISERIHQISHERVILNETLNTYRTLIKQHSSFPALSPEQDVSVSVYKMARDETQLKLGKLEVELENYKSRVKQLTGCPLITLPSDVKPERRSWPRVASVDKLKNSTSFKRIEARKQAAKDSLDMEIRQTTADYSVGPVARWTRDEGEQAYSFGIALTLPIGGTQARALSSTAQASYQVSEAEADYELRQVTAELEKWTTQYSNSIDILRQGFAEVDVHKKHQQIEKFILAGRVNASLAIEAHRQMLEHMLSRHEVEAKASEALWNIRLLTGSIAKEDL